VGKTVEIYLNIFIKLLQIPELIKNLFGELFNTRPYTGAGRCMDNNEYLSPLKKAN
jgi:hypothetical protein